VSANVLSNAPSIIDPADEGTVSFYNGGTLLCTVQLNDGQALCESAIDPATVTPHSLTASYNGTADFAISSATTDAVAHLAQPTIVSITSVIPTPGRRGSSAEAERAEPAWYSKEVRQ
jgi:hypothetical protein